MCFSQIPNSWSRFCSVKMGPSVGSLAGHNLILGGSSVVRVYGSCTGTEPLCPPPQSSQLAPFSWMKPQILTNSSYLHVSNLKRAEIQEAIKHHTLAVATNVTQKVPNFFGRYIKKWTLLLREGKGGGGSQLSTPILLSRKHKVLWRGQ